MPTEAGDPRTYGPPGPEKWEYLVRPQATLAANPVNGAVSRPGCGIALRVLVYVPICLRNLLRQFLSVVVRVLI